MSRSTLRARNAIIGAVSLAILAVAPAAQAYLGDWSISGEFERTTTPSFAGGFNPTDVDEFSAAYDNRAKTLAIDLEYFQVPGRDNVYVSFGTGLPDGSCNTGAIDVTIASRDITTTRTSRTWVPAQWYNSESRHYWRDGYWAIRTDTIVSMVRLSKLLDSTAMRRRWAGPSARRSLTASPPTASRSPCPVAEHHS